MRPGIISSYLAALKRIGPAVPSRCSQCGKALTLFNRDLLSDTCAKCRRSIRKLQRKEEAERERERLAKQEAAAERQRDFAANLFQDGELLVVAIDDCHFPNRCVITNEYVSGPRFHFREAIPGSPRLVESAGTVAGSALGKLLTPFFSLVGPIWTLATSRFLEMQIGLIPRIQKAFRRKKSIALGMVFGGMIAPFVLVLPLLSLLDAELSPALGFGGPICMVLGVVYFALAVRPVLRIKKSDGRYVWLAGAHEEFLKSLPRWRPPQDDAPDRGSSRES